MPVPETLLYLTERDVQQTLSVIDAVDLAEAGIEADAAGRVVGDKFYMPLSDDGFIKPFSGYLEGEELAFVKTFSFLPGNPERFGCPATSSMVLLFDAQTGLPVCLMEGGYITALKTGASTAVTAAYLARPGAANVTIFGAGSLGRMHLRALTARFALRSACVVDILPQAAEAFVAELQPELDFPVESVPLKERERAVREADIVLVCLSPRSVDKTGYLQKEIGIAVDAAEYRPEGTLYCVPVRLQACEVPMRLSSWQWVDLYESRGYERLMRTLRARAAKLEGVRIPT